MYEPQYSLERDDDHPDNYSQSSGIFAPLYLCPEHGETWHVQIIEDIDTESDSVEVRRVCDKCYRDVKPVLHEGNQVMHALTVEEAYWDNMSFGDEDEDNDEGTCAICGGEYGDGWSNCTCDE